MRFALLFSSVQAVDGDDAHWAALTLALLSKNARMMAGDPTWCPKIVHVANAMRPNALLRLQPTGLLTSLMPGANKISQDDTVAAKLALMLFANNLREHERAWADQLHRVAAIFRPGNLLRIGRQPRPYSIDNNDDFGRVRRLVSLMNRINIIDGVA